MCIFISQCCCELVIMHKAMRCHIMQSVLADHTAANSRPIGLIVGYWYETVICLSVCLCLCNAVHCGVQDRCGGGMCRPTVEFLAGHFLFTSSNTFAVATKHSNQLKAVRQLQHTSNTKA